jgi:hypothetical protein
MTGRKVFREITLSSVCFLCAILPSRSADIILNADTVKTELGDNLSCQTTFWNSRNGFFTGTLVFSNQSSVEQNAAIMQNDYRKSVFIKNIRIPQGSSAAVKVYTPVFPGSYTYWDLVVKNIKRKENGHIGNFSCDHNYRNNSGDIPLIRPKDARQLPDSFRDYVNMPTISLSENVWNSMNEKQRSAMLDWVYIGGSINFETDNEGFIAEIYKKYPPSSFSAKKQKFDYGLGRVKTMKNLEKGEKNYLMEIFLSAFSSNPPWEMTRISPPLMILMVTFFAILIGPGVIIASKRLKKPLLPLLFIPAISTAACIILLLISLLSDGITPKILTRSITHLDQIKGIAFISQRTGLEAPLGLIAPVEVPETSILYLNSKDDRSRTFEGRVVAENGKLKVHNFVLPRTPEFIALTKLEHRREKLDVREGNPVSVTNGLGSEIKNLLLKDYKGVYWRSHSSLRPGENAQLEQIGKEPFADEYAGFPSDILNTMAKMKAELSPGSYQADLEDNVFGEPIIQKAEKLPDKFYFLVGRYAPEKAEKFSK